MYLTKEYCDAVLESILKECLYLLNEYDRLSIEFNLNDFAPNEEKMEDIKEQLTELNKIVEGLKNYAKCIEKTKI